MIGCSRKNREIIGENTFEWKKKKSRLKFFSELLLIGLWTMEPWTWVTKNLCLSLLSWCYVWATVALSVQSNFYHFIKTIVWVSFSFFKPSGLTKFVREINSGVIEVFKKKKLWTCLFWQLWNNSLGKVNLQKNVGKSDIKFIFGQSSTSKIFFLQFLGKKIETSFTLLLSLSP